MAGEYEPVLTVKTEGFPLLKRMIRSLVRISVVLKARGKVLLLSSGKSRKIDPWVGAHDFQSLGQEQAVGMADAILTLSAEHKLEEDLYSWFGVCP
jgi:hypothetical protein